MTARQVIHENIRMTGLALQQRAENTQQGFRTPGGCANGLAVEWAVECGGVFDFIAHPTCLVVEDPKFETIKLICQLVEEAGDRAAIVDLNSIAASVKQDRN